MEHFSKRGENMTREGKGRGRRREKTSLRGQDHISLRRTQELYHLVEKWVIHRGFTRGAIPYHVSSYWGIYIEEKMT